MRISVPGRRHEMHKGLAVGGRMSLSRKKKSLPDIEKARGSECPSKTKYQNRGLGQLQAFDQ